MSTSEGGDGLYFLGELEAQDRATYLGRVGRLTPDEVESAVEVILTNTGQVKAFDDGTVIVSDVPEVITRAADVIERLNAQVGEGWIIQFFVVQAGEDGSTAVGVDGEFSVDVAAGFGELDFVETGGAARAAFRADIQRGAVRVVSRPLFLLVEGESGVLSRSQRVPIAQQTVLENGAVVTSGFSQVDVGTQFEVLLRGAGEDGGLLEYSIRFGEITSFVEDRPVVTEERLEGTIRVLDGGTYLVGSLERSSGRNRQDGFLGLQMTRERGDSLLEVWVLAERVGVQVRNEAVASSWVEKAKREEESDVGTGRREVESDGGSSSGNGTEVVQLEKASEVELSGPLGASSEGGGGRVGDIERGSVGSGTTATESAEGVGVSRELAGGDGEVSEEDARRRELEEAAAAMRAIADAFYEKKRLESRERQKAGSENPF